MSEECIAEYKDDLEGGVIYYCDLLLEDYDGDGQASYQYAESHATWEEIPEIIIATQTRTLQEQSCIIWWRRNAKDCFS